MTLEEHILDELAGRDRGLDAQAIKLVMQERTHALTTETQKKLIEMGRRGLIGFDGHGRWKLAEFCSPDLIRAQMDSYEKIEYEPLDVRKSNP